MGLAGFLKKKKGGQPLPHPASHSTDFGPSRQQSVERPNKRRREPNSDDDEADLGLEDGSGGVLSVEPEAFDSFIRNLHKRRSSLVKRKKAPRKSTAEVDGMIAEAPKDKKGDVEKDEVMDAEKKSLEIKMKKKERVGVGEELNEHGDREEDHDEEEGEFLQENDDPEAKGVEDFFKVQLSDLEAADLGRGEIYFQKSDHPDYQSLWPNGEFECSNSTLPDLKAELKGYGVCPQVREAWQKANKGKIDGDFVNPQQNALFAMLSKYLDVFVSDVPYPSSYKDEEPMMDACVAHCVNHIFRSLENLRKTKAKIFEAKKTKGKELSDRETRDRGFTSPKVLFLVPMRSMAFRIMEKIFKYGAHHKEKNELENYENLLEEYGPDEKLEAAMTDESKPADFNGIFGGNVSDAFKIGLQFSRTGILSYANFYRSDIVIASPLSLSIMLSKGNLDFLSSIEIAVIDRADVSTMQNWQHVISVVRQINSMPKSQHDVNIMRVRELFLKSHGRHYRQTIMLSSFATAEMNSLFNGPACTNHRGKVRLKKKYRGVVGGGATMKIAKQIFERHGAKDLVDSADDRLEFFREKIIPKLRSSMGKGVLIFIPHYFDYVRLRTLLQTEEVDFCWVTEYSEEKHSRKCRAEFVRGEIRVMLFTERAFFYTRPRLHGIRDVIFYSLPEHAHYYSEIVNMLEEPMAGMQPSVISLFSKFTGLQLERIVGRKKAKKMLKDRSPTFLLC
ncbi:hypothetical protein BSKO_13231 [Bryopsis sp. KO-2023]|nr:hypothetical protein BSKO_13231 [Bryopsis sp. KO-2023]